jgi:hypothetical protein
MTDNFLRTEANRSNSVYVFVYLGTIVVQVGFSSQVVSIIPCLY